MSAYDEILGSLPLDQIAAEVGAQPQEVEQASAAILPALLGGLHANATGGGSGSILQALGQHDPALLDGGVDLSQVDTSDGEAIASHIFGGNQDQVVAALGGSGASGVGGGLVKKLIPILAPIVLSWLAKQVLGKVGGGGGTQSGGGGGGGLGDILGSILGGGGLGGAGAAAAQPEQTLPTSGQQDASGGGQGALEDMLKDILGSAASSPAPQPQTQQAPAQQPSPGNIITDVLGGLLGGGRR
jgi:hypothetical protein